MVHLQMVFTGKFNTENYGTFRDVIFVMLEDQQVAPPT